MIETERLVLRPFLKKDAEDLYEDLGKPMVNCFASMKIASMKEAVNEAEKRSEDHEYCFAIVLKESGKVIGEIAAHPESVAPENDCKNTFT